MSLLTNLIAWYECAESSADVTIRNNTLVGNGNSIIVAAATHRNGQGREWRTVRNLVTANHVTMDVGRVGRVMDDVARKNQSTMADVRFTDNTYVVSGDAGWIWDNWQSQKLSWSQWQE